MITNTILLLVASHQLASDAGKIGAYGVRFDPKALTCACRMFHRDERLRVTDIHNGSSVIVTVTDRTRKDHADRIDLSPAAFSKLNGLKLGTCDVKVERIK